MGTFSTSQISVVFFTLVFLAVPTTSYPLDNICKQTKNPGFCFNLLNPHSSASLKELDRIVIDTTTSSVTETRDKTRTLLSQNNDPKMTVVYSLCINYYASALSALDAAKEKLKLGEYRDVASASSTVASDASACRKAFALAPSQPVPIAGDNDRFDLLSSVFVVVSRALSG